MSEGVFLFVLEQIPKRINSRRAKIQMNGLHEAESFSKILSRTTSHEILQL
jgi:hypothetical protein